MYYMRAPGVNGWGYRGVVFSGKVNPKISSRTFQADRNPEIFIGQENIVHV
jgi:hypothetical protein